MASSREQCRKALILLLRPMVRFALRHALKFRDMTEMLKCVFVQLAQEELSKLGEEATMSKLSLMTGLQRLEVSRLLSVRDPEDGDAFDVLTRVIGVWKTVAVFRDAAGRARILSSKGRGSEFGQLVARVSKDLNPYTVAFELERAGLIEHTEKGLRLLRPGFETKGNTEAGLRLLAKDSEDLLLAVDENIFRRADPPNLHARTEFDNISAEHAEEIRHWLLRKGGELHAQAREYLSQFDRDLSNRTQEDDENRERIRVVIGTFSFSE